MNLRDLRYIVAVADFGHFGRAAEACNVSQPTLSGQIRKLEEELGLAIFERVGHTVRPTAPGGQILDHARRALAAAEDIVAVAQAGRDPLAGPLHLGVIPTLGPYLMPYALPAAQQGLRALRLVLVEDLTVRLIELVAAGKLDAAITASDPETPALQTDTLFDEDFWLVLGKDNPLAARNKIGIADIDPRSLLLLTDGHCLRDQALELCGPPRDAEAAIADMRATSLKTLLHMAAAGYGMTRFPALALKQEQPLPGNLVARRLSGTKARRRVRLIFRPSHPRRAAIAALSKLIRASVKDVLEKESEPAFAGVEN
jgi:LysR family transcriptional regulator, hydrogen peroxide-inducible genes activator